MNNIIDIYSLTPTQEGMFFQNRLHSSGKSYHLQYLLSVEFKINAEILRQAVRLLSLRHDVLRSAFAVSESTGNVKQAVLRNREPEFTHIRFGNGYGSGEQLTEIAEKDADRPFDLTRDSLFRVTFVEFSDSGYLVISTHHIITDGWSLPILAVDLMRFYKELASGCAISALELKISKEKEESASFAAYTEWLKGRNREEAVTYWRNLFRGYTQSSEQSNDEDADYGVWFDSKTIRFGRDLTSKLKSFAAANNVSVNSVFETALGIVLLKDAASDDIVFGKVVSGRNAGIENMYNTVGTFINTIPVRVRAGENSDIYALLKDIHKQSALSGRYGFIHLSEIYRHTVLRRNSIKVLFVFENYPFNYSQEMSGFKLIGKKEQTDFDLTLTVMNENGEYCADATFSPLYENSRIDELLESFKTVLTEIADKQNDKNNLEVSIQPISLANSKISDEDRDKTVHELFEEQVEKNPEKTAVIAQDRTLSYKELNEEAGKIAAFLADKGVKKGDIVALKLARKSYMLSAIFGILKSGAAYLPVDMDSPDERTSFILADSKAEFCISEDNILSVLQGSNAENQGIKTEPDDNFCIIYTSGSTGTPKGAILKHRGIVNFIKNSNVISYFKEKNIEPVGVSVNSVTFDYFIAENIVLLACGYKTVLASYEESVNADRFGDLCNRNNVNLLQTTPTRFSLFMKSKNPEYFKSFKLLVSSGEPLTHELFARIRRLTDAKVINPLGPSETSVWILDGENVSENDIHLGKPMANTQIYVVDNYMNIVPTGTVGELCVAGECVGAGYLNRPELTAEKFIKNPFGEGVLYKTGDLVYLRDDGNVVYAGRKDNQIKLNGQRIEAGEIESALSGIDGIGLAAAVVRKNNAGNQIICAFYSGDKKESAEIRNELGKKLPGYMIPQIITHLDEMPLTASGKIDRLSLPEIDLEHIVPEKEFIEAKTRIERMVCDKFSEILHVSPVSMNTDFFFSGGSSIDVLAFLSDERFRSISAPEFIANPTPAGICAALKNEKTNKYEYLQPLFVPEEFERAIVLFPYAGGNAESYSELVREIRKLLPDTAVYFIRFLHSVEECRAASEEVTDLKKICRIYFYAHCIGDSVALQIADFIEENQINIDGLIVGANIPAEKPPKYNRWHLVPDAVMKKMLIRAGSRIGNLNNARTAAILRRFRDDSDFATFYFKSNPGKISSQITVIISKNDIFTPDFEDAEKNWQKYTTGKVSVRYIESDSHYFQAENADVLAEMIAETIKL